MNFFNISKEKVFDILDTNEEGLSIDEAKKD